MTIQRGRHFYLKYVPNHSAGPGVMVGCGSAGENFGTHITRNGYVRRADFIEDIETELDVLVIDRADLPEVHVAERGAIRAGEIGWSAHQLETVPDRAGFARTQAYTYLALADHLDKNPPVDEAAVNALTRIIDTEADNLDITGDWKASALARRLVQAGVTAPTGGES